MKEEDKKLKEINSIYKSIYTTLITPLSEIGNNTQDIKKTINRLNLLNTKVIDFLVNKKDEENINILNILKNKLKKEKELIKLEATKKKSIKTKDIQIKSRQRVKDLAEVFTNPREVNAMLDLTKELSYKIKTKYLEPACGTGNFLIEIIKRKLITVFNKYNSLRELEYYSLRSVSVIYGIDICPENIKESKERMILEIEKMFNKTKFKNNKNFINSLKYLLDKNIIVGDSLNKTNEIFFSEFVPKNSNSFIEKIYNFDDLNNNKPKPIKILKIKHYLNLSNN